MKPESSSYRKAGGALLAVGVVEIGILFLGPYAVTEVSLRLFPPAMLALAVGFLGTWLIFGNGKPADRRGRAVRLYAESLLSVGLLFFLFRYIFAANANMDYVQRFIASGGELNLAIDTSTERTIVALRFGPSLLSVFLLYLFFAARQHRYELLLTLLSVGLSTLSLPSAISTSGIGVLGWIGIVPLLFVLWRGNLKTILFYGVTYGVLTTVSVNYWLGTFSLVSLGAVTVIYLVYYTVFMLVFGTVILLFRDSSPALRVFLTAALWTMFEYVRSVGFLAYPWGLVAHSQYTNLWLIQISEITGVWGVTFNVVLFA